MPDWARFRALANMPGSREATAEAACNDVKKSSPLT